MCTLVEKCQNLRTFPVGAATGTTPSHDSSLKVLIVGRLGPYEDGGAPDDVAPRRAIAGQFVSRLAGRRMVFVSEANSEGIPA